MSLPCPICSNVIQGAPVRPLPETPVWFFAFMKSTQEGKRFWIWTGCKHAAYLTTGSVEEEMRSLTEAKWDVEARRLFEERTASWPAHARESFGRALGFIVDKPI